jgi:hypothetical protein
MLLILRRVAAYRVGALQPISFKLHAANQRGNRGERFAYQAER